MARSSNAIPAGIAAQPGSAKALSKPHPLPVAVMATAMAAPGARTRTTARSTSRRPRLCGQRASRSNERLRRGASASHSATAPNTARNTANLIAPSNSVMLYSIDHLNTRTGSRTMSTNAKRDIFANLARIGTALSSPTRIEFLELLAQTDNLEPVPAKELLARARRGLVTVLDVRPPEEYAAGHLPGAVNIPIHELEKRLKELPKRREIVAYCRGPYCLMSYDAVALLRKRGIKARRLEAGLPEWRLAGLPVERH